MRPLTTLVLGALLAGSTPGFAQEPTSRPAPSEEPAVEALDLDRRFQALEAEFDAAMEALYRAYDALPEDAGPEHYPPYPGVTFYPRFRELADAGQLDAMFWCLENVGMEPGRSYASELEAVLEAAPNDPRVGLALAYLHWSVSGPSTELLAVLDAYVASGPHQSMARAALGAKGMLLTMDESDTASLEAGLALLDELLESEADFPGKDGIAGHLFKLRNLGIGMLAPDWTGTDIDGQPIALSDYHGKVTVLEFWGFW